MSKVTIGIGTSHSPLLTMGVDNWVERSKDDLMAQSLNLSDGRFISYQELLTTVGPKYADRSTAATFAQQYDSAQRALDRQAQAIEQAAPDIVVVVGDDQGELFDRSNMPSIAIYHGDEVVMHPWPDSAFEKYPWRREAARGYSMDGAHRHAGAPEYALGIIQRLIDRGVDLTVASEVKSPETAGFGHAFGFIVERLFGGRRIPMVPVLLNTYFPPNVPTPSRCYDVGVMLGSAIAEMPDDLSICVVASGGLSHFVTDEALDRRVLEAMRVGNVASLRSLPREALNSGSSEILNWVLTAGAVAGLADSWVEYLPVYRTPAGTGVGLAFGIWK